MLSPISDHFIASPGILSEVY